MHAASGWYPDPTRPGTEHYWDGNDWTDARRVLGADLPEELVALAARSTVGFELPSYEALALMGAGAPAGERGEAPASAGGGEATRGGVPYARRPRK